MARYHSGKTLKSNCHICNKVVTNQNMKMHIKMAHTKEKTTCDQCGKIALNIKKHTCSKSDKIVYKYVLQV